MSRSYLALLLFLLLSFSPVFAQAEGAISGTVLDAVTGKPIPAAIVTCGDISVQTDDQGRYTIAADGFRVMARAHGYRRSRNETAFPEQLRLDPFAPKALYLSFYGVGSSALREPALDLIASSELNAVVVDIKGDRGMLPYPSRIPLARSVKALEVTTVSNLAGLVRSLKDKGIYTIGRIVVFKDPLLAAGRPDLDIMTEGGKPWIDHQGLGWVDPFRREVWEYNIDIAIEAARAGFDEVQFDYVRFPARKGLVFSRENTEESRVAAIGGFLDAARKRLSPYNVFLSADIFGYVCWNLDDTSIGQRLEDLTRHVDYLSPMLYPSGFAHGVGEYENPLDNPYEIIYRSLARARQRSGVPAVRFRPWLQAFRDYAFDRRAFGEWEIEAQTEASENFGTNGWMLWNPGNRYRPEGLKLTENQAGGSKGLSALEDEGSGAVSGGG